MFKSAKKLIGGTIVSALIPLALMSTAHQAFAGCCDDGKTPSPPPKPEPKPLVTTNEDEVNSAGLLPVEDPVKLEPGLYYAGEGSFFSQWSLLVERNINDPDKNIVIMIPLNILETSIWHSDQIESDGYILQSRVIENGSKLMLSSLWIDSEGNPEELSESRRNAPVALVSKIDGPQRFPFEIESQNGLFPQGRLGMRAAGSKWMKLNNCPSAGRFGAWDRDHHRRATADRRSIALYNDGGYDMTYQVMNLNGTFGKFSGLSVSTLDTLSQTQVSDGSLSGLVTFVTGSDFDREMFIVAKPSTKVGVFKFTIYKMIEPSFLDWLFSGRTTPAK